LEGLGYEEMTSSWEVPVAVGVAGCLFVYVLWFFWNNLKLKVLYYSLFYNSILKRGVEVFRMKVAGKKGDSKVEAIISDEFLNKQKALILDLIEDTYNKKLEREVKKNGRVRQDSGKLREEQTRTELERTGTTGAVTDNVDAQSKPVQTNTVTEVGVAESDSVKDVGVAEGKKRFFN
jgi:hypothetical protein